MGGKSASCGSLCKNIIPDPRRSSNPPEKGLPALPWDTALKKCRRHHPSCKEALLSANAGAVFCAETVPAENRGHNPKSPPPDLSFAYRNGLFGIWAIVPWQHSSNMMYLIDENGIQSNSVHYDRYLHSYSPKSINKKSGCWLQSRTINLFIVQYTSILHL